MSDRKEKFKSPQDAIVAGIKAGQEELTSEKPLDVSDQDSSQNAERAVSPGWFNSLSVAVVITFVAVTLTTASGLLLRVDVLLWPSLILWVVLVILLAMLYIVQMTREDRHDDA